MPQTERKLAAIMFTDIVGYTKLTQEDEGRALRVLEAHRSLVRSILSKFGGREIKTIGDAFLVEFGSALEAVECGVEIQTALRERSPGEREGALVRIGIHVGDVVRSGGDIYGDAVNIASRIEPLAGEEEVCISQQVYDQVKNKLEYQMVRLPAHQLKNVKDSIDVYRIVMPWERDRQVSEGFDARKIAVLPFANFSSDPADGYFADGMTEEVISTVAGIRGLSVISRTSVMGYKGTTKRVREIGEELGVGSVLEGSFRKAGNRVRITAQLIAVADDRHVWSQSYDRELNDVFAVQSDIAKQVANSLRVSMLPEEEKHIEKTPTEVPEAHSLYLKGRYYWNERSKESLLKAIEQFEGAIKLDPSYALAYSGIADCYAVLGDHQHVPYEEAFRKCKEYATKAVELDDRSAEAHTSLGNGVGGYDMDMAAARAEFKRAIELNPSYATAHHWYGINLLHTGHLEDALAEARRAQELDPLSPQIACFVGIVYDALGRYNDAEGQHRRALDLQPGFAPAFGNLAFTYLHERKYDDAERMCKEFSRVSHDETSSKYWLATINALAGREGEARKAMAEAEAIPNPQDLHRDSRILFHIAIGEPDQAVELIEREFESRAGWLGTIAVDPLFAGVRDDPRVKAILDKLTV